MFISTLLWLEVHVHFLVEPFPQYTQYIYILIYIKGSTFLQTAVNVYIYIYITHLGTNDVGPVAFWAGSWVGWTVIIKVSLEIKVQEFRSADPGILVINCKCI